jgi:ribosomal protein S18 acetylase RimI-like enzyme
MKEQTDSRQAIVTSRRLEERIALRPFCDADLQAVVNLHMLVFTVKENFAMRLGRRFVEATYRFFLEDSKCFGFVVRTEHAEVVGVLVGRLGYYTRSLNRYRFFEGLKAFVGRPSIVFDRSLVRTALRAVAGGAVVTKSRRQQSVTAWSHDSRPIASLASLCTHPTYRELGITDQLLSSAEELCSLRGAHAIRTGVRRTNVASRFAFRRRGYIEDPVLSTEESLIYVRRLVSVDGPIDK